MNTAEFLTIATSIVSEREALVQGNIRRTYAQLRERVDRLSHALATLGVRPGARIAVVAMNCPQYVETYYACAKLGATLVPLNYRAKREELAYMLDDSAASMVFVGERYLQALQDVRDALPRLQHFICYGPKSEGVLEYEALLAQSEPEAITTNVNDDSPSLIIYTSGTTGKPKGVVLSHFALSSYVLNTVEPASPELHDVQLVAVPFYHIAGATTILSSIFSGRTLAILPQFEAADWLSAVERERATHSFLVPTMLKRVIEHPDFSKSDLSSLKLLAYGAASMPYHVIRRAVELFSCGLMNAYGQTESTSTLTYLGPDDHRLAGSNGAELERKLQRLRSVGRPMSDVEMAIVDPQGRALPAREAGEVAVRGDRIMAGYLGRTEETASAIIDGWLHTGDMGYLDEDGYLYLTGRANDLIIRGGENIAPGEIKAVLEEHPAIAEAAVVGVPSEEWGEEVKAAVVLKPGEVAGVKELQEHCRSRLASYKVPKHVVFVADLPRNSLGKVLKAELREQ